MIYATAAQGRLPSSCLVCVNPCGDATAGKKNTSVPNLVDITDRVHAMMVLLPLFNTESRGLLLPFESHICDPSE